MDNENGENYNPDDLDMLPPGPGYNNVQPLPGPGYNLAPPTMDGLDRPLVPEIPGLPPELQPYGNGPGFADGPPLTREQYEGNRGSIEALIDELMRNARPPGMPPPQMMDEQIDRIKPRRSDAVTTIVDPEVGPKVQWSDPSWPLEFTARNPQIDFDENKDPMSEDPSHVWKYNTGKIDNAEQMVQDMIHMRMKNMKFR